MCDGNLSKCEIKYFSIAANKFLESLVKYIMINGNELWMKQKIYLLVNVQVTNSRIFKFHSLEEQLILRNVLGHIGSNNFLHSLTAKSDTSITRQTQSLMITH